MAEFIYDCNDSHHSFLPVSSSSGGGAAFVQRQTLCLTCLAGRFDSLPPPNAARALQDAGLLLQESFCPSPGKRSASAAETTSALEPLTADLGRIAVGLCSSAALHAHAPLYKAAKALLSLVFTLLPCDGGGDDEDCDPVPILGFAVSAPASRAMALTMCDTVASALSTAGEAPGGLLLLTDLADMSPAFLGSLAAHGGVRRCCAMLSSLRDAYRVELVLYLLHQLFSACATRPTWLEALARELVEVSFLDSLAWSLGAFREEEPVIVNALCLARFVTAYDTTRNVLLTAQHVSEYSTVCGESPLTPVLPRLLRGLTALLLHLNPDIVVASAEALRAILVALRPFDDCSDMADYVLESLRTAPAASAEALVQLLNALPTEMVPAGPALRVLFTLPTVCVTAFESATRGPHLRHAARDRTTSASNFAQLAARSVQAPGVTLDALLSLLDCVAVAVEDTVPPEAAAAFASALLRLVDHTCGADSSPPATLPPRGAAWPFADRLAALRGGARTGLARGVALLWPASGSAAIALLAAEVLAEALRRPEDWAGAVDADPPLRIAAAALDALVAAESPAAPRHCAAAGAGECADEAAALLARRVRCLLRCDLLAALLRIPGASPDTRALLLQRFVSLAPANRHGMEPPDPFVLDAAPSPRALLERAAPRRPRWAAALLLALAAAQCPAPLDTRALDTCVHAQLEMLARHSSGGAVVAALRTAAAYHAWRDELPAYEDMDASVVAAAAGHCVVAAETRDECAALLSSASSRFINALAARRWGTALLSLMIAGAVLHRAAQDTADEEKDAELCRLVVSHNGALAHLFVSIRQAPYGAEARGILHLVCRCVVAAGPAAAFTRRLLEQQVAPLALLLLHSPPTNADPSNSHDSSAQGHGGGEGTSDSDDGVGRLAALALSRIAPAAASGCDHALFTWALARVASAAAPDAAWQVLLLLLERTHGAEFALRHETALAGRLQAATNAQAIGASACIGDALRWAVESSARRRGAMRWVPTRAAPLPLASPPTRAVRAFVAVAAAREADAAGTIDAAPELLAWAVALLAERCASPAAARLAWRLLRARPALAASLEALALFWQFRHAQPPPAVEEGAWLLAALIAAWPPWAEAAGLAAAAEAFLAALDPAQPRGGRRGARRAVRALVEACGEQSARCGGFPMSRARDFFLKPDTAGAEGGEDRVAGFAAVDENVELFLPSEEDMPAEREGGETPQTLTVSGALIALN